MERGVVVGNRALEEFRERLERWDELCRELRELYYKYLDLAAFRSEKCYFPGRRCKRSWERQYDLGDLTLMWTYILNTAPLCGKLMRALAEVEYEIRKRALESLERYGGIEKRASTSDSRKIVHVDLGKPVYVYLILWGTQLYAVWEGSDGVSQNKRSIDVTPEYADILSKLNKHELNGVSAEVFEIDHEYRRLWPEIPLPKLASELLGGRCKAPLTLFRNLGWLLSDDKRQKLRHRAGNVGQISARIFDWIALAKYATQVLKIAPDRPLMFKLIADRVTKTSNGNNPSIEIRLVGDMEKTIRTTYNWFGITLKDTEEVIKHGYAVLKTLREEAFKREGKAYVVDDVYAWIAFSNITDILIIGDGSISLYNIDIGAKSLHKLAEAVGGTVGKTVVHLRDWYIRLLLPIPPIPAFKKTVKLYEALVKNPAAAMVMINGNTYLLTHIGSRRFTIGRRKAAELYNIANSIGLKVKFKKKLLVFSSTQLKEMSRHNIFVQLLNELEKEVVREVKPVPSPHLEILRAVLEKIMRITKIKLRTRDGQKYIKIILRKESDVDEVATLLRASGIRFSVSKKGKAIMIYERRSVEAFQKAMSFFNSVARIEPPEPLFPLHFFCQSGVDAVKSGKPIPQNGGHPTLYEVEPAVKAYLSPEHRTLQSFQSFDMSPEQS